MKNRLITIRGMMLIMIQLLICLCLSAKEPVSTQAEATQEHKVITGTVKDASGMPVIGATVTIKGGKSATITDFNGNYSIKVLGNTQKLTFSYMGMKTTTVDTEGKSTLTVTLEELEVSLHEVVAVGYGTLKKSDMSGAVESIKLGNANDGDNTSMDQYLQGRSAGVNITMSSGAPGATSNMLIRGGSSISGSNQPLYIVDGFPLDMPDGGGAEGSNRSTTINPLASLNPNNIESVEILKDASATSIYGSRGANGVVLIKTKEGKKGSKISYSVKMDLSQVAKKIPMLNTHDFLSYQNEATFNTSGNYLYPKPGQLDSVAALQPNVNWQDLIFRNSYSQDHQVTISGADDKTNYSIAGNYMDKQGIILNSSFNRYSLNGSINRIINSMLNVGMKMSYSNINSNMAKQSYAAGQAGGSVILGALFFRPLKNAYNTDGSLTTDVTDNPMYVAMNVKDNLNSIALRSQTFAELSFSKYLKFKTTFGVNDNYLIRQSYEGIGTYVGALNNGYAQRNDNRLYTLNTEQLLSYNRDFNKDNRLSAVLGYTYQKTLTQNMSVAAKNFVNETLIYYNFQNASAQDKTVTQTYNSLLQSYLGRLNYTLLNRYIFTVSGRADGTSRLAHKWAYFPSGAFAWRVNDEPFFLNFKENISNLKLRVSYGQTGNQSIAPLQTLTGFSNNYYPIGGVLTTGVKSSNLGNNDLKWETTSQYNTGVDFGVFNNRLRFTADLFYKRTTDLLLNMRIPSTSGYTTYWTNGGEVENKGFELSLAGEVIAQKKITWTLSANISSYANKLLSLSNGLTAIYGQNWLGTGGYTLAQPTSVAMVGSAIGSFIGYKTDGVYQNQAQIDNYLHTNADGSTTKIDPNAKPGFYKLVDSNGDGKIDANDRVILGSPIPKFIFGINSNFTYINFDFNFLWSGSIGNQMVNLNRYVIDGLSSTTSTNISQSAWDNRWRGEGSTNDYQLPYAGAVMFRGLVLDKLVEDASYIRLKNLTVAYRIPVAKSFGMSMCKVFASVTNLITITKYSGLDPEASASTSALSGGIDLGVFPQPRTYSAGATIEF